MPTVHPATVRILENRVLHHPRHFSLPSILDAQLERERVVDLCDVIDIARKLQLGSAREPIAREVIRGGVNEILILRIEIGSAQPQQQLRHRLQHHFQLDPIDARRSQYCR